MLKRHAAIVVALAVLAIGCSQQGSNAVKIDSALYGYIPADATFIAGARINHLRNSPIYATFRVQLPAQALPYEKEASELVVSTDGVHTLVLARGKFDRKRIENDIHASKGPPAPVEWLADDLVAIGDKPVVNSAKRRTGSPLTAQIPSAADLWLITSGHLPFQFPERSNLANLNRLAQDLQVGVLGFKVTDAIQADGHFDFANEQASEQAQTALRGFIGLARLSTPTGKEQLLQALDAIQVASEKSKVTLKADWPPALVKALVATLPAR